MEFDDADGTESPSVFVAITVNEYDAPLVRPVQRAEVAGNDAATPTRHEPPVGLLVTE